jgi:hypothetical protein
MNANLGIPEPSRSRWSLVAELLARPYPVTASLRLPFLVWLLLVPGYLIIGAYAHGRTLHMPGLALDRTLPLLPVWTLVYGSLYFAVLLPLVVVRAEEHIRRTIWAFVMVWIVGIARLAVFSDNPFAAGPGYDRRRLLCLDVADNLLLGRAVQLLSLPPCRPGFPGGSNMLSRVSRPGYRRGRLGGAHRRFDAIHQTALRRRRDFRRVSGLRGLSRLPAQSTSHCHSRARRPCCPGRRAGFCRYTRAYSLRLLGGLHGSLTAQAFERSIPLPSDHRLSVAQTGID